MGSAESAETAQDARAAGPGGLAQQEGPARHRASPTAVSLAVRLARSAMAPGVVLKAACGDLAPVRRQGDSTSRCAGTHADRARWRTAALGVKQERVACERLRSGQPALRRPGETRAG